MTRISWPEGEWLLEQLRDGFDIASLRNTKRTGFDKYTERWHYETSARKWDRREESVALPPELVRDFAAWLGDELQIAPGDLHMNRGDSWQWYFTLRLAMPAESATSS